MISNIFLFTWEEKYLLHQELKRRTDGFVQKYWTDTLFVYKTDNFSLESLRQSLYSWWLFVQKKMIVVYGFPLDGDTSNKLSSTIVQQFSDEFLEKKWIISWDTILIFVSYKPDKRTKFYTFLKKELGPNGIKEFSPLKNPELKQFVRQKTENLGWTDKTLDSFLTKTGAWLFHIQNELDKLSLYSSLNNDSPITEKDIGEITFWITEANNFAFFDLLFENKQKALDLIVDVQNQGLNWNAFVGTLYWWLKNWVFILDCFEQNIKDSKKITSLLKVHPFVVAKTLKNIDTLSCNKMAIYSFYKWLIELDSDIKSGNTSELNFWLDVKKMVFTLF